MARLTIKCFFAFFLLLSDCGTQSRLIDDSNGMTYGSFAGYLTGDEIWEFLVRWNKRHPLLSATPSSMGKSVEGLRIPYLCVGKTCQLKMSSESSRVPGSLHTSLIHSREPMALAGLVFFLNYLDQRITAGDASILALLATREIWFAPLLNPDGYAYNERKFPSGGGMQRKNRNPSCKKSSKDTGVDLNRNYNVCFERDGLGSSNDPCAEDYGGSSVESEPESAALDKFVSSQNFKIALNFHSFGRTVNFPFMCKAELVPWREEQPEAKRTAEQEFFVDYAKKVLDPEQNKDILAEEPWTYGHPWEGDLYTVNGALSDWMYHDHGILAMAPEMGPECHTCTMLTDSEGFWPAKEKIQPLAKEVLQMNLHAAWAAAALPTIVLSSITLAHKIGGEKEEDCKQLIIDFRLHNNGLSTLWPQLNDSERSGSFLAAWLVPKKYDVLSSLNNIADNHLNPTELSKATATYIPVGSVPRLQKSDVLNVKFELPCEDSKASTSIASAKDAADLKKVLFASQSGTDNSLCIITEASFSATSNDSKLALEGSAREVLRTSSVCRYVFSSSKISTSKSKAQEKKKNENAKNGKDANNLTDVLSIHNRGSPCSLSMSSENSLEKGIKCKYTKDAEEKSTWDDTKELLRFVITHPFFIVVAFFFCCGINCLFKVVKYFKERLWIGYRVACTDTDAADFENVVIELSNNHKSHMQGTE
eukprot:g3264.t1